MKKSNFRIGKTVGAVEYTNCTSAEGEARPLQTSVLDMTLNNLMARFR